MEYCKRNMTDTNSPLKKPDELWDLHYQDMKSQGGSPWGYDSWLERWKSLLLPGNRVLDLGCGTGDDTLQLEKAGCKVVAGDFSFTALHLAGQKNTCASFIRFDLSQGLPFAHDSFSIVIANLCLHYFPWPTTVDILDQIHKCLKPKGTLLARFNSTHDSNFGAEGHPSIEPNALLVNGMYKRYFDKSVLENHFRNNWHILNIEEMTIFRYSKPKVLWELAASNL